MREGLVDEHRGLGAEDDHGSDAQPCLLKYDLSRWNVRSGNATWALQHFRDVCCWEPGIWIANSLGRRRTWQRIAITEHPLGTPTQDGCTVLVLREQEFVRHGIVASCKCRC